MSETTDLLTAGEVADLLRVSAATVYRWAEDATLSAVRIGGVVRFRRSDVMALLDPAEPSDAA